MNNPLRKPELLDQTTADNLVTSGEAVLIDVFESSLHELFFVQNPQIKKGMPTAEEKLQAFLSQNNLQPIYIYFPWYKKIIKTVPEKEFYTLRTARNKNIITEDEQKKYREATVGIAGLSVGSGVVAALTISGGPETIKIADFDTIEITNLNRIRAKVVDLGSNKTSVTAREVWDLDPFTNIEIWPDGITYQNLEEFLLDPRLDIFIDECEDIGIKIKSRIVARKNKIPVLMATDNGDNVIVDVERFDLEPERPLFHGLIADFENQDLEKIDFKTWLQLATKIVGPEYLPTSMKKSLLEIGKTVASVPQLGSTAHVAGSAISYVVRAILNDVYMPSGRYVINFEKIFNAEYDSPEMIQKRVEENNNFINKFGKQ